MNRIPQQQSIDSHMSVFVGYSVLCCAVDPHCMPSTLSFVSQQEQPVNNYIHPAILFRSFASEWLEDAMWTCSIKQKCEPSSYVINEAESQDMLKLNT